MKLAITNPTNWPYVRRGAERFANELAAYLAKRGHEVTLISGKPGASQLIEDKGFRTLMHRRLWHPSFQKIGFLEFHAFFLTALHSLVRERYHVVVSCTFIDAFAAELARGVTGTPCVFWVNGLPPPIRYVRSLTLKGAVFRSAIRGANEVVALSRYMQAGLEERFGRAGLRIPPPVDLDGFPMSSDRNRNQPIIMCFAALEDERKGARLLMRAFNRLKALRPDVRLQLAAEIGAAKRAELLDLVSPQWRGDVDFLGAGKLEDLPSLYGRAAVTVLPSRWEPFGLVVIESLAAGSPVVATRDGAIPEILTDDRVGRLFDPGPPGSPEPTNLEGLVSALVQALELSRRPETPMLCRAHAERFSWKAIGPRYESLLQELAYRKREIGPMRRVQ